MPAFININENEVISMYLLKSFTIKDICEYFGVSKMKIRTILKKNKVESKSSKKYEYYDEIFNCIDTEEKAYWLGFLYADGYVRQRKSGSELRLKLSSKDKNHLLKFKKFISPDDIKVTYDIYNKSESYKISISSKKIVSDLIKNGCVNRKSNKIEYPNIHTSLNNHFIRGYFDGDGSISYGKSITLNFVSGSFKFLNEISNTLNYESKCKKANLVGRSENFRYLSYTTLDDIEKLYKYLYFESTVFLERKRERIEYIISNYTNIKKDINKNRRKT